VSPRLHGARVACFVAGVDDPQPRSIEGKTGWGIEVRRTSSGHPLAEIELAEQQARRPSVGLRPRGDAAHYTIVRVIRHPEAAGRFDRDS